MAALFGRSGLRQTHLINSQISPSIFQTIRRVSPYWKVFVGGLGQTTNDTNLREAFKVHGEVLEAKVIMDRKSGKSRGFGFVTFDDVDSAFDSIIAIDQWLLHGQTVTVRWAKDKCGKFTSPAIDADSDYEDDNVDDEDNSNLCT